MAIMQPVCGLIGFGSSCLAGWRIKADGGQASERPDLARNVFSRPQRHAAGRRDRTAAAASVLAMLASGCATVAAPTAAPTVVLAVEEPPVMVAVVPGSFVAGSTKAETDLVGFPAEMAAREQPARRVTIARPYRIARDEVTRGQFRRFAVATGWRPDGPCSYLADGPANRWESDLAHDWLNPGFAQTDDHPVVCVNLSDAQGYAAWLSRGSGRRFRLPSSSEWEYAARAGTTARYWWGEQPLDRLCRFANVADASRARAHNRGVVDPAKFVPCDDGHVFTAPVGSFAANPWGLRDVIGNVWEWTLDCVQPSQSGAPDDSSPRSGGDCRSRIDRGASWTNSPKYVRVAVRHPDLVEARTAVLGFRLVEELP